MLESIHYNTTDHWHLNKYWSGWKFEVKFSVLLLPLFLPVLPQAAEVKGGFFSPRVSINQTEAFFASATAAAPFLCVTLILEKTTPPSSAHGTDPLWISSSLLELLSLSFSGAVASADETHQAESHQNQIAFARSVQNRYGTFKEDYPSEN